MSELSCPKNLEEEKRCQPAPAALEKFRDSLVADVEPVYKDDDDDDGDDGGAHSITGTGSPLTAAHNNLNSLGEHRPDSVQCSAFTAAGCCLGQRGTHSLAAVAADKFNQRKEFKINIALHQPDTCQVWTTLVIIATLDRWSGPKQFGNPEMLNNRV